MEGRRAKLDSTVLCMFPYAHKCIKEPDREALVRRGLITREQLSRFEGTTDEDAALTDISDITKALLVNGECSSR